MPQAASGSGQPRSISRLCRTDQPHRTYLRHRRCLLLPALNDARTGFWEALKFADAVRGGGGSGGGGLADAQREVLVRTDLHGGHFRVGNPQQRAEQRAYELGFLLDALEAEAEEGGRMPRSSRDAA